MVAAPDKGQHARGQPADQVARFVEAVATRAAGAGLIGKWIGDKAGGGEGGAVQVALGQTIAANVQFADDADGDGLSAAIEYIHLRIGNRCTDRHTGQGCARGRHLIEGGIGGAFSWSVDIDDLWRRIMLEHTLNGDRVCCFAAKKDGPQRAKQAWHIVSKLVKKRSGEQHDGDLLLFDIRRERHRGEQHFFGDAHQARPVQQSAPDFKGGGVEGGIGKVGNAIRFMERHVIGVEHQAADAALRNDDAFGLSGGARCVHHVGRIGAGGLAIGVIAVAGSNDCGVNGGRFALQVNQGRPVWQKLRRQVCAADQEGRLRISQHKGNPFRGVGNVQRHVHPAGFDDRQDRHDHVEGAFQINGDDTVSPGAALL